MFCNNSASRHQTRPRQCPAKLELKLIQRLELAANIYSESSAYLHRDGGNEICFVSTTSIWHLVSLAVLIALTSACHHLPPEAELQL